MSVDAHSLSGALDDALDLNAIEDEWEGLLRESVGLVRRAVGLTVRERRVKRRLAKRLDDLTRVAHASERPVMAAQPFAVKALARRLRPALRVAADPGAHPARDYAIACDEIRDVLERCPRERLLSKSLAHELGRGPHNTLVELLNQHTVELAA